MNSIQEALNNTAQVLLSPVQAVVSFFTPWERDRSAADSGQHLVGAPTLAALSAKSMTNVAWPKTQVSRAAANQEEFKLRNPGRQLRPMRVLRIVDSTNPPHSAGRMVISGRISEVCAELERLSRQEVQVAGNLSEVA